MNPLLHIAAYKLRAFVKSAFDLRPAVLIRGLGSMLVFGAFAFGAFRLSLTLTEFILEQTRAGLFLYHQFISMMLFVFFVAVNLGNIIVSYSTLYRSPEVAYLMTKPVPFVQVFLLKFLDNFLYSSGTLFLIGFMVLLGYGTYFRYEWHFFITVMLVVLVPFMFLSASLAVLVLMAIMKAAGRFGFRTVMGGLFVVYALIIGVFFQYSNPVALVERVQHARLTAETDIAELLPGFLAYLPNQWVADFLHALARGEGARALGSAGILLGAAIAVFLVVIFVAKRFYYRSWMVSLQVQSLALAPYNPHRLHLIDFRRGHSFAPQVEVLLKKELFSFLREPSQWIHFIVMIVLTGLFVISVSNLNLRLRVVDVQILTYLVLFAFGGFMTCSLALRFVFPMIGLEGKQFWVLRGGPVDLRKVYFLKFAIGFVVVLFIAECIAFASNIPFVRFSGRRPLLLWFGVYEAFWISLAVVSMNLGFGAVFANYNEKNPIRAASSQGATLTFLFTLFFLLVHIGIVLLPLVDYFTSLFHFTRFDLTRVVVPGTALAVVSMLVSVFALAVGLRAARRDF